MTESLIHLAVLLALAAVAALAFWALDREREARLELLRLLAEERLAAARERGELLLRIQHPHRIPGQPEAAPRLLKRDDATQARQERVRRQGAAEQ